MGAHAGSIAADGSPRRRCGGTSKVERLPFDDIDCPEDVDRDGDVDSVDLALVLTSSNSCGAGRICWEDVNGDCQIDNADVRLVILAYGPCGGDGPGLSAYDVDTWLAAGGGSRLDEGSLTAAAVCACLDQDSPAQRLVALYALLMDG